MAHALRASLVEVKQALAAKYDHLAELTSSRPRRRSWKRRADRYRRQAEQIRRHGKTT